ncbi:MAG: putative anti-sigma regulatory factor [Acidimicrobiales bacterium]|jgi:anti-sigma regulatory factor (Ser/Thr protein kinase)|nr:putative anti-sigma regulatory factor [Acidimicrobiales bacterium]
MATEELVRLDIPALPAFVGVARSVVTTVATSVDGIGDDRLDDLRLAVSEACTNAVDGREVGDHRVVLRCVLSDDHLDVRIEDVSDGFSAEAIAERGWGLQLITALVDDVTFSREGGGSSVTLRMDLEP